MLIFSNYLGDHHFVAFHYQKVVVLHHQVIICFMAMMVVVA